MGWDLCVGLLYEHRFAVLKNRNILEFENVKIKSETNLNGDPFCPLLLFLSPPPSSDPESKVKLFMGAIC